ncbi:hypothetical protein AB0M95_11000 [Sphaerisporangium sp. NPDC051017]|uniref:hypothetical protein n=1 Tax=Sphaerisporangium sp. NPDC051017 TaxID=3154636 RepID=UPI0034347F71
MSTAHLVGRFVADRARAVPSAVAIDGGGVPVTYGELHERSAALAARLRAAGYSVGDVVTRPGCDTDAGELLGLCRRELASFKVPVAVEFVAELPRSGLDKVLRRELRRRERDRHRPHCENSEEGAL